jgi:mannan endo-1,4-beta-mannosidase
VHFNLLEVITVVDATRNLLIFFVLSLSLLTSCSLERQPQEPNLPPRPRVVGDAQFGIYIKGAAWDKSILYDLEGEVGHNFNIIQWFTSWPAPFESYLVDRVHAIDRLPLITWQSRDISLQDINAGLHDGYIRSWARGVKNTQDEVYLRPFPEMNGDWVSWNGNPEALKKAWRHIVDIFQKEGADNVRWVWSPNVTDEPKIPENRMELYYPGDDVVDILALDGFNWGTVRSYTAWKEFDTIFTEPYARITALGNQPVWLAEIASTEHGGDKAQWINNMLESTAFPKVDALIWFNEVKETDWRMESSDDSLKAFRTWFISRNQQALAAR